MDAISNFLAPDHERCDDLFYLAEAAALRSNWETAAAKFAEFLSAMNHHFAMEEEVLFPAYEQASGHPDGPPAIMRMEHAQMRELLDTLGRAIDAQDGTLYAGTSETLLVLMRQHNLKEEQMLYRMCDRMLAPQTAELISQMSRIAA